MYPSITFILVFGYINIISPESISNQGWSNIIQDLSLKIHDYKSDEKIIESHPLNEGFILLSDNPKKSSTTTSKPARPSIKNRIIPSHNISSTTCTTIIMVKIKNKTSPPIGHLGRRLLNDPSYDTDIDTTSIQTPIVDDGEINSFLKVDDEELNKQLINVGIGYDGSGETTEETTEETSEMTSTTLLTTTTSTVTEQPILSNSSKFILVMNCTNANTTLHQILEDFDKTFDYDYIPTYYINELQCNNTGRINVTLEFFTDNNITTLNKLFEHLKNATTPRDVEIFSVNKCGNNGIVPITNVTSCYLIDMCHLCGSTPPRGICLPESKLSKCRCFANDNDTLRPYVGEFCLPPNPEPIKPLSYPSRWTPIIVGILAGLTGLFLAITCCLWTIAVWRRNHAKYDLRVHRLWHLPRAQVPTSVTNENVQTYLNNTISTLSSKQTDSDYNQSDITDSTFFKELDQKMGENLRATITRPNTQSMLASLPTDTISSRSTYDPIDELDSIIDNEDVNMTFHDPLNELYEDNEILEVINPNIKLPRPNVDSKPTGLFSFLYNNS